MRPDLDRLDAVADELTEGLASGLGYRGTVALLEMAESRLDGMIEEAQRKWQTDGKIYAAVGSSCGMIAALLVM